MRTQTPKEEVLNTLTHAIAVLFGIIGLYFLINSNASNYPWGYVSVLIYGLSFILLFIISSLYHAVTKPKLKKVFRVLDHITIYYLIAGTYTPVLLILLPDSMGWPLLYIVWSIALFGTVLKLFFTGKYELFSSTLYLLMGWLIVFDFTALSSAMTQLELTLLFSGGFAFTLGIIFYALNKLKYNHVIWHVFVLIGAICHYFMVLNFVR